MKRALLAAAAALAACGGASVAPPALVTLDEEGAPVPLQLPLADPFREPSGGPRAVVVGHAAPFHGLRVVLDDAGAAAAAATTPWRVAYFKPTTAEQPWAEWEELAAARGAGAPGGSAEIRWDLPAFPPWEMGSLGAEAAFWVSLSAPAGKPSPAILSVEVVP